MPQTCTDKDLFKHTICAGLLHPPFSKKDSQGEELNGRMTEERLLHSGLRIDGESGKLLRAWQP